MPRATRAGAAATWCHKNSNLLEPEEQKLELVPPSTSWGWSHEDLVPQEFECLCHTNHELELELEPRAGGSVD
jgi:hypothetical protein